MAAQDYSYTDALFRLLKKRFGAVETPLNYTHPHELAIAVILSAQCTDERVNLVTPELFKKFPRVSDYYTQPLARLEKAIFSTGFYRNKARNIREFCRQLDENHNGDIPRTMDELVRMPGIGRKTANVIIQVLFDEPSGMVVDTHVARLSRVLGLSQSKDPKKIEIDLMEKVRKRYWIDWSLYMIYLGRSNCTARRRDCGGCPVKSRCPSSTL